MADFTWVPVFGKVADWLLGFEKRQLELISVLQKVGISNGLTDKSTEGEEIPLAEIDPFTFYAMFMKYGIKYRVVLFSKLIDELKLNVTKPTGFDGVPSANAQRNWLFPSAVSRKPEMIESLWRIFRAASSDSITNKMFEDALAVPNTGFTKLTECLFYAFPDRFFPVDRQTRPWLKENGIAFPDKTWESYKACLAAIKEHTNKSFAEISYEAWHANQGGTEAIEVFDGEPAKSTEMLGSEVSSQNQILYGPPGTGKTYETTRLAVKLAEPEWYEGVVASAPGEEEIRAHLKGKYDELSSLGRIGFTTFHQSLSYEDFIEGIRAWSDEETKSISYEVEAGIFKQIADMADRAVAASDSLGLSESPKIWKISIGPVHWSEMRNRYIENGEARIGWNDTGDLNVEYDDRTKKEKAYWDQLGSKSQASIRNFAYEIEVGDVFLCLRDMNTVQAVGVVTSEYVFDLGADAGEHESYAHVRKVNWFLKDIEFDILPLNKQKRLVQQTCYQLDRFNWDELLAELSKKNHSVSALGIGGVETKHKPNYVLIIDEINRGNIARVFGELITLLEPDKRKGGSDSRSVVLPYSKKLFSVPSNLYVIGTMNTADRSLAQIDLALRRRFEFVELPPKPDLLDGTEVFGVDVGELLEVINNRIEVLLDRDHLIGHSYFFPLLRFDDGQERETMMTSIFRKKILPLLQEYFYSDWERICWVLNDLDKKPEAQFVQLGSASASIGALFSSKISAELTDRRYRINEAAFENPDAYRGIIRAIG